jgi:hypothetical protein
MSDKNGESEKQNSLDNGFKLKNEIPSARS